MPTHLSETVIAQQYDTSRTIIQIAGKPFALQLAPFTAELDTQIHQALAEHEQEQMTRIGIQNTQAYTISDTNNAVIGAIAFRVFWGALHIKYLYVDKQHRHNGIGTLLVNHAINRALQVDCPFVLVETTSYQALHFYQKLGFSLEFSREGFSNGVAFHYLRKTL